MAYSVATYLRAGLFQTVWGFVKYLPTGLGDGARFVVLKMFMKRIDTAWIHSGVTIWWPERISIGNGSVNEDIHLNGYGGITVGDRVMIGHRTTLFSDDHQFGDPTQSIWDQGRKAAPIVIEDEVYLGCNVVVLAGVTIGRGAVVGANSVVTDDIPALAIAAGAPAKVVGFRGDSRA
jgi:acetyltransferase-like isoleucine patch superfamily enzyme